MNKEERLELENELLMTCSKAQAINKYIDELEENMVLTNQWYKLQQENKQLKEQTDRYKKLIEYLKKLDFYEFELDYDYEENPIDNYYPADMEYHINNWLANEKLESGDNNE